MARPSTTSKRASRLVRCCLCPPSPRRKRYRAGLPCPGASMSASGSTRSDTVTLNSPIPAPCFRPRPFSSISAASSGRVPLTSRFRGRHAECLGDHHLEHGQSRGKGLLCQSSQRIQHRESLIRVVSAIVRELAAAVSTSNGGDLLSRRRAAVQSAQAAGPCHRAARWQQRGAGFIRAVPLQRTRMPGTAPGQGSSTGCPAGPSRRRGWRPAPCLR